MKSNEIIKAIEEHTGIPSEKFLKRHGHRHAYLKKAYVTALRSKHTTTEIGEMLGLDHSTIVRHSKDFYEMQSVDKEIKSLAIKLNLA
jgi:DNA-binding transcriptional ArsR family regulator